MGSGEKTYTGKTTARGSPGGSSRSLASPPLQRRKRTYRQLFLHTSPGLPRALGHCSHPPGPFPEGWEFSPVPPTAPQVLDVAGPPCGPHLGPPPCCRRALPLPARTPHPPRPSLSASLGEVPATLGCCHPALWGTGHKPLNVTVPLPSSRGMVPSSECPSAPAVPRRWVT